MLKTLFEAALDIIYPPRQACPVCAGHSPGCAVCPSCRDLLDKYAGEIICPVCGAFGGAAGAFPRPASGVTSGGTAVNRRPKYIICPQCRGGGRAFDLARSVGPYEGPLREAVHRFKYRGARGLAGPLAALMAGVAGRHPLFGQTRALVPVPLSPDRERERGFNQALLLARELEQHFKVPVLERAVVKIRETPPQAELSRQERLVNLANAFIVPDRDLIKGKKITIIDDVITTGSTVSKISHILRQAGAEVITVLTFAGTRINVKS
ncbi:ComF family protein [Desulfotruncus alcoholivorax]|uniref:ComF family protein n=1 Tax=Desulfotruncus alcoholivorax TaxID=265477 RepID=UPI0004121B5A|nr:ComF family protein [Desulfotruncus alcoholivorax]